MLKLVVACLYGFRGNNSHNKCKHESKRIQTNPFVARPYGLALNDATTRAFQTRRTWKNELSRDVQHPPDMSDRKPQMCCGVEAKDPMKIRVDVVQRSHDVPQVHRHVPGPHAKSYAVQSRAQMTRTRAGFGRRETPWVA